MILMKILHITLFHHYNDLLSYLPTFENEHATAAVNAYAESSVAFARKFIKGDKHRTYYRSKCQNFR